METLGIFKALADEIRLRIVRAVSSAELSVAELVQVLDLPQSTVSRHLKPLREAGLVAARRDGTSVYYHRGAAFSDRHLAGFLEARLEGVAREAADRAAIRRVLDLRRRHSRSFFDEVAGRYGTLTEPGGGWSALAAGLAAGFSGQSTADLGSGEGGLTLLLARFAEMVHAVDQSPKMLRLVAARADELGLGRKVQCLEGDLERLPLPDESVDSAFLSQALHHASRPENAVVEAARILRPGGRLVVLDLARHEQEWVREQWADQWLGFDPAQVRGWMEQAGLQPVSEERLPGSVPDLAVILVVANKI